MKAEEAKRIATKESLPLDVVDRVFAAIGERARDGHRNLVNPFGHHIIGQHLTESQKNKLRLVMEENGYEYQEHKVPVSPDPREHDWDELRW